MKPFVSAVLSFLMPGLGQFHNGQLVKGIVFYLLYLTLFFIVYFLNLLQTFSGLVVVIIAAICLYLYIIGDAVYYSIKSDTREIVFLKKWPLFIILIVIHVIISGYYKNYINDNYIKAHLEKNNSMSPTLLTGDYFIADYNYYKDNPVIPNDVVIIRFPGDPDKKFIKRCIATGGQEIEIKDKVVYIDGKLFADTHKDILGIEADSVTRQQRDYFGPVTIPSDYCFVLGDNRDNSYDSRFWGPVPIENVLAKPLYIYWSNDHSRIGRVIN